MGLGQWIIIIVLIAIILFGFAAVFDFSKGVIRNVYPIPGYEPMLSGIVVKVLDGDTIELDSGVHVRMALVQAPEKGYPGAQAAKDWLEYRCLNQMATVDPDDRQSSGSYNRVVGAIYCNGFFLNQEMIQLNLAVLAIPFCDKSEFGEVLCL